MSATILQFFSRGEQLRKRGMDTILTGSASPRDQRRDRDWAMRHTPGPMGQSCCHSANTECQLVDEHILRPIATDPQGGLTKMLTFHPRRLSCYEAQGRYLRMKAMRESGQQRVLQFPAPQDSRPEEAALRAQLRRFYETHRAEPPLLPPSELPEPSEP